MPIRYEYKRIKCYSFDEDRKYRVDGWEWYETNLVICWTYFRRKIIIQ